MLEQIVSTELDKDKKDKKIKVLICVNVLTSVNSFVYSNHIAFFSWTAKNRPDIDIVFFTPERMAIDTARNTAAIQAMLGQCDYLLFLDDDVLIPPDSLDRLIKADRDIIAGLVIIRGYPFNNMVFKKEEEKLIFFNDLEKEYLFEDKWIPGTALNNDVLAKELPQRLKQIQDCDAVGFSLCLIKVDLLTSLLPPYFVTGPYNTEDVYFCMKVQDNLKSEDGKVPTICVETSIQPGHIMSGECVEYQTKQKFIDFYKDQAGALQAKPVVRDAIALDRSLQALGENHVKA